MATNVETMWVSSPDQLNATVTTLVAQGGVVQNQAEGEVQIFLKKKMNIVVLIVGLILCLVPGLAYLIWYTTADQSQQITVKIGSPANIKTEHTHWYDQPAVDGASPGTVGPEIKTGTPPAAVGQADPATAIPAAYPPPAVAAPIPAPIQDAPVAPEAAYPPPAYPPPAAPAPEPPAYPPMPPAPPAPPQS